MRNLLIAAALIGLALASPASAADVGCVFPTADDARPCSYAAADINVLYSDGIVIDVAERSHSATCDWNPNGIGTPIWGACPAQTGEQPAPVAKIDEDAQQHAQRTWEWVRDNGGCNAAFIPHEIAAYCFNHSTNRYPASGPIGASQGGD